MGGIFSDRSKEETPGRLAKRRVRKLIRGPRFEPCGITVWWPDEQQVQKLVKMGFAEADVISALQDVYGDEILAIKKLRSAECAPAGNDTNTKDGALIIRKPWQYFALYFLAWKRDVDLSFGLGTLTENGSKVSAFLNR